VPTTAPTSAAAGRRRGRSVGHPRQRQRQPVQKTQPQVHAPDEARGCAPSSGGVPPRTPRCRAAARPARPRLPARRPERAPTTLSGVTRPRASSTRSPVGRTTRARAGSDRTSPGASGTARHAWHPALNATTIIRSVPRLVRASVILRRGTAVARPGSASGAVGNLRLRAAGAASLRERRLAAGARTRRRS
jgi:hypothetical protein